MARPRLTHSWVNTLIGAASIIFCGMVLYFWQSSTSEKKAREEKQSNMVEWVHQRVENHIRVDSVKQADLQALQQRRRR
jgi:hypothetical protein